jgi:hypothetical protein
MALCRAQAPMAGWESGREVKPADAASWLVFV